MDKTPDGFDYVSKNRKMIQPVQLDDIEIAILAKERAKQEAQLEELQTKASDISKEWKEKIQQQERLIETLGADIGRGKQDRTVMCDEIFRNGKIDTVRQDTGVVISSRAASMQEAQRYLPAMEGQGGGMLADARKAQKDAGVEEDEDGDVVSPEGDGKPKTRKAKKS